MTWCECSSCGHHRSDHPWVGRGEFGTVSGYSGCRLCRVCGKPEKEHAFTAHVFDRCTCQEYAEVAS